MVFSSPIFLFLFLPFVLGLYVISVRRELRNPVLLVASLFFYAWGETWFVLVMVASMAANYLFGLWVDRVRERPSARIAVTCAVVFNLGLLGAFKYANFFVDNLNALISTVGISPIPLGKVHLPIGISFFTFQALSYVVDVYRRKADVQRNPINVALYISLFPQLIAGPIVRYRDVAKQLVDRVMSREDFAYGVRRFVIGLGKKVLVANVLGGVADKIFGLSDVSPPMPGVPLDQLTPALAWMGAVCFTLQVYYDFSGYSDMAIGLGRMFGFHFLENFNYPYISRSMREMWQRWHISLTTWFRDFVFVPLGGYRRSRLRSHVNLVTVFVLCGLWHGASWTFIIWGLYNGVFLVVEGHTRLGKWLKRRFRPLGHTYALLIWIVGTTLFRSETLSQFGAFFAAMAGFARGAGLEHQVAMYANREIILALVAGALFSAPILPLLARLRERFVTSRTGTVPAVVEGVIAVGEVMGLVILLLASASWLAAGTYNPFIYFRF